MDNIIDICDELSQNFIEFAYEANSQRAFPDARDGLKPGQRACLWEMYSKGYISDKPHVKCAKIDGGVIGAWWPHGQTAVYETFGRMSMPWVNNIPEVDFHGNNGNVVIGQALAADRYTEARLAKIVEEGMFQGINKNNVPMVLNFSEDAEWPEVLPSVFQRLLVNGCQGIGLTVANTWLPMNMTEVGNVTLNYLKTGILEDNLKLIDFCSGGEIINKSELPIIHKTGKGKVILRGTAEIKDKSILITELPYQVYVEPFIDSIKDLIAKEEITLIKDIYNKTDKKRLLIEIECTSSPLTVLNQLYEKTDFQCVYNANQMALVGKTPKLLNLKDYLDIYIQHNIECITKEYEFDINKCKARQEIVEGLLKALEDIDNVINLIKKSSSSADAVKNLIKGYSLTEVQAKAIVDMKLGRLANLEQIELQKEAEELRENIKKIATILKSDDEKKNILTERLSNLVKKYGTSRKTKLLDIDFKKEKKTKEKAEIEPEKVVVILTEDGSIKRIPATTFKVQSRNTKGIKTQSDIVKATIRTNTVDSLLVFSNFGKVYRIPVNDIPVGTNTSQGQLITTLVQMGINEKPCLIYSVYKDTEKKYIVFITENGLVKKTTLEEYNNIKKKGGSNALKLREGDALAAVSLMNEEDLIVLTSGGMGIRFNINDISPSGKTSIGVKGINLKPGDKVVAALPVRDETDGVGVFSLSGLGKRIKTSDFSRQARGGKGVIVYKPTATSGEVVAGAMINDEDSVLLIGNPNSLCISGKDIPILSRQSAGNQLIKGGIISSVSKI